MQINQTKQPLMVNKGIKKIGYDPTSYVLETKDIKSCYGKGLKDSDNTQKWANNNQAHCLSFQKQATDMANKQAENKSRLMYVKEKQKGCYGGCIWHAIRVVWRLLKQANYKLENEHHIAKQAHPIKIYPTKI